MPKRSNKGIVFYIILVVVLFLGYTAYQVYTSINVLKSASNLPKDLSNFNCADAAMYDSTISGLIRGYGDMRNNCWNPLYDFAAQKIEPISGICDDVWYNEKMDEARTVNSGINAYCAIINQINTTA